MRPGLLEVRRGALTIRFVQLPPHRAAVLFRHGRLDEAPVPLGDIRAALADGAVAPHVRVTPLLAVDALRFEPHGALADLPNTRRVYWQTADRADYQALVPEGLAGSAVSLVSGAGLDRVPARAFRAAKKRIATLPPVRVDISAENDETLLRSVAPDRLLARPRPRRARRAGQGRALRSRRRALPQDEAIVAQVAPATEALAALNQAAALAKADDALYASASVIPVAWAVDARFVSSRVRGWREDRLGDVDYARVTLR